MQVGFQWDARDSYDRCYRQSCMDSIDSLPAAMPWCEYIRILQAVINQLEAPFFTPRMLSRQCSSGQYF